MFPSDLYAFLVLGVTLFLSLMLMIRFYKNGRGNLNGKYYINRVIKIKRYSVVKLISYDVAICVNELLLFNCKHK